jgi:vancomycin resistance protein YoaR
MTIGRNITVVLLAFPVVLTALLVATYPFSETLAQKKFSISMLTPIQRSNIQIAARAINGTVLKPGEAFSFNRVVGPRNESRGYRPAPSYLGPENPATIGGGVCLVSSAIYQLALEAGFNIQQRIPHLRTIKTVPAGLDATVWYGQADLRFTNTLSVPVQIATDFNDQVLTVTLLGRKPKGYQPAVVERIVSRSTSSDVVVELLRRQGKHEVLISRDHYAIAN